MTLLTRRALVTAKIETVFDEDALPTPALNAMLVGQPNYSADINQLTRDVVRRTLSPLATKAGRKIGQMTFTHEVRSNGLVGGTAPSLGVLLRGCGMQEVEITSTAAATIGDALAKSGNTGTVTWAKTTAFTGTYRRRFTITCTTPGASGVAQVSITAPAVGADAAVNQTNVTLTDATPVTLANAAQVTPTIGVALVAGDTWYIDTIPVGFEYKPISENFESLTIYMYLDGLLHKMTGARGTFQVDCPGGNYGTFTFTFRGSYVAVTDVALPNDADYENVQPGQVELAALHVNGNTQLCAARWQIDIANNVVPRECVNAQDAFEGVAITSRAPTASFDPEATLVATHDFWGNLANGTELYFFTKVGTVAGNIVSMTCPNVQYTNLAYGDRESIRTFDVTMNMATSEVDIGDNELIFNFS